MAMTKERIEKIRVLAGQVDPDNPEDNQFLSLRGKAGVALRELIAEVERLQAIEADVEKALDETMFLAGSVEHPMLNKLLQGHGRSQRSS